MSEIVRCPKVLLPKSVDMTKWAVVACDQFTSQPKYWEAVQELVGDSPSTLKVVLPEIHLSSNNIKAQVAAINNTMKDYLSQDMFNEINSFILVKRTLSGGAIRLGLMLEVDLEAYEYTPNNTALVKATERTVLERLPARIEVRSDACLELPHIMLLCDDRYNSIIEPLYADSDNMTVLYDFDLNMNGGRITGYKVENTSAVIDSINALLDDKLIMDRYRTENKILFCVGDGNHSLATAKECWNNIKKSLTIQEQLTHPARFCLCELVNLHDESLAFEPIHRIIKGADVAFIVEMTLALDGDGRMKVEYNGVEYILNIPVNPSDAIKDIQDFIDKYLAENEGLTQDYIHGDNYLKEVAAQCNGVAIFMPTISKDSLFDYCIRRGVLPRKSFSMGVAEDKRYYLEARKINNHRN